MDRDPDAARRSLQAIEAAGRAALADLDDVLGLLRESAGATAPAAPASPVRDLRALGRLVQETRDTGADVSTQVEGDVAAVAGATSREAFRIVQEALTNALRHAAGRRVAIGVRVSARQVEVRVSNPATSRDRSGAGRGLVGMAERVTLLRGELDVGEHDGTWTVRATLPRERA